jgi:chloramphenicol 3-O phosphotransferase
LHVAVDIGHHDDYATPRHTLGDAARRLAGLPAWLVGVRCPLDVVMARRDAGAAAGPPGGTYLTSGPDGGVPAPVRRWQEAVHDPGVYDLELDTSVLTPAAAADAVLARIAAGPPPTAFRRLAAGLRPGPPG